ncbi:hypothetical protein HK096_010638, partial [Nowakowskiella sp. JEL0078]
MGAIKLLLCVFLLLPSIFALTLTYTLDPHERACFYSHATYIGEKLQFFYSVRSGGEFDVDYEVLHPDKSIQSTGTKERSADFVFSAKQIGEYSFCFSNGMSSFSEKVLDFEISTQKEVEKPAGHNTFTGTAEQQQRAKLMVASMQDVVDDMMENVAGLRRHQGQLRVRTSRSLST